MKADRKTRERMSEGEDHDVYVPVARRFHPGLCALCLKFPNEISRLKHCSQCFLVSYCSRECQKKDWKIHKSFCGVNAAVNKKTIFFKAKNEVTNQAEWNDYRNSLQVVANMNLKRPLEPFEREIIWCPRVCEVCRDAEVLTIMSCKSCHSVFYCSEAHKVEDAENHRDWCKEYVLCGIIDGFERQKGISNLPFPVQIYESYSKLPQTLSELLESELNFCMMEDFAGKMFKILISERLTDPLTLLYSLQHFYIGNKNLKINESPELVIHVVGAESTRELLGMIRWEYLAHRLPSLLKLRVAFVGPNIFSDLEESDLPPSNYCIDDMQALRCEDCSKRNRRYVYEMCRMLYHEYTDKDYYKKPDAIIAFNGGFHEHAGEENDTWPKSLSCMLADPKVPVIYTSYTKTEANKDLVILKKLGNVSETLPTHPNPYRSLRPVRDFYRDDGGQLFYINQYVTCINGRKI